MGLIGTLLVSLSLTIVMIPILQRLAPRVGLLDMPDDARKVHRRIIARCGGIGLGAGALAGVLLLRDAGPELIGYVCGALVILAFGVWDDIANLDYRWKFAGQIVAVAVVMWSGTMLHSLPLLGDSAPLWLSAAFTFFLLLGVTNAVNLVDGLDGLAGGCTLLSLAAMAILGQSDPNSAVPLVAVALIGAILGFLRFNTWPALIFMGDAGSQFLGFSAGVLAVWLIETEAAGLHPAMVLLLLGLPIMDTLTVMSQRIAQGRSPFSPDKGHIHHKLLSLGFHHGEAVSIIYVIQASLVVMVFALVDASDLLIILAYCITFAVVVGSIEAARRAGWRLHAHERGIERRNLFLRRQRWLPRACDLILIIALALFMLMGALAPHTTSTDAWLVTGLLGIVALVAIMLPAQPSRALIRICTYMMLGLGGWTLSLQAQALPVVAQGMWTYATVILLVLLIGIRVTRRELLSITPQDALVALIAVGALLIPPHLQSSFGRMVPIAVVNFFTVEFLLEGTRRGRLLGFATACSLILYAFQA